MADRILRALAVTSTLALLAACGGGEPQAEDALRSTSRQQVFEPGSVTEPLDAGTVTWEPVPCDCRQSSDCGFGETCQPPRSSGGVPVACEPSQPQMTGQCRPKVLPAADAGIATADAGVIPGPGGEGLP